MLDIKKIREDFDGVKAAVERRGKGDFGIGEVAELDKKRREVLAKVEAMKNKQSTTSKQIPKMKKAGEDTTELMAEMKALSQEIKALDAEVSEIEENLKNAILNIPNTPHESVPMGEDDSDNVELRKWGEPTQFDFEAKAHWDIGEDLDILDICLPTFLHADYSIKAMEKGMHVICEKPISLHAEDVERIYSTAHQINVKFMVAQVLRFWPEYELLKELYDSQKYGKLLSASLTRLGGIPKWSWDNWMRDEKRSGLVPFDLHIHDLDFIIYAFGTPNHMQKHRSKRPD